MASFHDIIAISNKNSAEEIKNFLSRNDTKLMSGKSLNSRYKHSKITDSGYQKSTAKTSKKTNSQSSIGPVGDSSGKGGPPKNPLGIILNKTTGLIIVNTLKSWLKILIKF